ncbi:hypothetical protein J1N35_011384, partial [Gossypium stocksii]
MKKLQSYELILNGGKLIQEKPEANLDVGHSFFKGKQKGKRKKKLTKSSVPPCVDTKKAKKTKDPEKIKSFFYNKKGHFKSNYNEYLDYLAKKGK